MQDFAAYSFWSRHPWVIKNSKIFLNELVPTRWAVRLMISATAILLSLSSATTVLLAWVVAPKSESAALRLSSSMIFISLL